MIQPVDVEQVHVFYSEKWYTVPCVLADAYRKAGFAVSSARELAESSHSKAGSNEAQQSKQKG